MKIRLAIERDLNQIASVGKCVNQLCKSSGDAMRIELLIAELLTNIIKHSRPENGQQCEFPLGVTLESDHERLRLSVSEVGRPMSKELVKKYTDAHVNMPALDGDLPESGWGVQLIKSLCDDISYERRDNSNVLHMCFDLNALVA